MLTNAVLNAALCAWVPSAARCVGELQGRFRACGVRSDERGLDFKCWSTFEAYSFTDFTLGNEIEKTEDKTANHCMPSVLAKAHEVR